MRLDRTGSLLARARSWLRDEHVLAPADSALRRAVGGARQKARALLTQRMTERLSAAMRDRLDALVAVGDDDPHSPLHRIKSGSSSPSVGGMKRLLARLELIEATGVLEVDIGWVNGNYQRILFHTVRTVSADRVREMAAPRRHLALVCFLHQAWRDTLDQAVDMYGKLLDRNRKLVEARLDDMLKAQRQAVDRIVHRYRRLGAVLLDPDVGDDELRARLLSTVPEAQLREDQSDLASWTRGDRKARFEQTAERHAGLSRFAGPFLSRMKFVDEQGEGASPTLSALRAYREHRAAGRRGVPPDAPLDFAPAALQPLIRHDGVTDRRRWESALFLKVRDEIQTGNLAIDGAKNFGRFEAFFLPAAEWERVREAFWARTGFPVEPAAAVEQLKARLSDAFDRFLEGVADNRQVAFDDDGWRLKADAAEQPDPAQSDSLAELHRWLDARSRSIRLADLLIEVENDLGFSVHFQQPGEKRVDPGEVCPCSPRSSPTAATSASTPWRRSPPTSPTGGSSTSATGVSSRRTSGPRSPPSSTASPASTPPATGATARRRPATGSASPCRRRCCSGPTARASTTSRSSSTPSSPTTTPRSTAARSSATDRDAPFMLDGVLYHESDLDLEEHYTDTHGYTEINFAAFGMVGMRFCPRIRSLHRQRIYCADQGRDHGVLEPVLKRGRRAVNFRLIAEQWDRIGQFYAAFPAGHATASAALQRLNRFQASNRFYAANRELGRALKTEFVLQYMSEPQLRAKVRRGLLKVEQLHALARAVYYGQRARISAREVYDQVNACSCLTLILACIVYWQAREISRMAAAPDFPFAPDLLRHVSPIEWKNVVLYGEIKIDPPSSRCAGLS